VTIALLDRAVVTGRPVPWWGIMAALGYPEPPDGVNL
jgi:hypothetical protein